MKKLIASLQRQKQFLLRSQGSSMLPILRSDDVVYFKKTCLKNLKINDLVLVKKSHQLFTHRIIYKKTVFKKDSLYLITKGDNNPESDGKIYPKQIIGKVTKVKRDGKEFDPNQIYLLQSSLYFQEIIRIKSLLEKQKINFVFLKGLPLHLCYEKEHPRRIYADCDVLIDKKNFQKAEKIIEKFGYKKTIEGKKQVENNYFKVINGFPVVFDIHLEPAFLMTQFSGLEALYPQKLIDRLTEELLNNKKQIIINNEKFLILNSKFLILYLSLHLFHHNFRGAFRYEFLDKVIRKSRLSTNDWQNIASIINNYQLTNFVSPVFVLLKKYYKTPIPGFFLKDIKSNFMNFINFKNLGIFDDESRIPAGINRFKNLFFLSPRPLFVKVLIIFNPQVLYSIFWILQKKLSSFFSGRQQAH